jgi:hypothetical protein
MVTGYEEVEVHEHVEEVHETLAPRVMAPQRHHAGEEEVKGKPAG